MMNMLKWTTPVVVLVSMMVAGCHDACNAKIRAISERLETVTSERDMARSDYERLAAEHRLCGSSTSQKDAMIQELKLQNTTLAEAMEKLKVMYKAELAKGKGEVPPPVAVALPQEVNKALTDFATQNPNMVEYDRELGMLKFKSDFTFPPGGAKPTATAVAAMGKLVEVLNTSGAENFSVYVAGHTDDVPVVRTKAMHPNNWYLSVHRAVGVVKALEQAGLSPDRICAMGFGEWQPVEPNAPGKKGNAKNRRVELWIVPKGAFIQTGAPAAAK